MNHLHRISEIIGILLLTLAYPLKLATHYHYYIWVMLGAGILFYATQDKTKIGKMKLVAGTVNLGLCLIFIFDELIKLNTYIPIYSLFITIGLCYLVLLLTSVR